MIVSTTDINKPLFQLGAPLLEDAQLAAAAPDLLALLKETTGYMWSLAVECDCENDVRELYNKAAAAIAKAEPQPQETA